MEYKLGYIEKNPNSFNHINPITQETFIQYEESANVLREIESNSRIFELLIKNYCELKSYFETAFNQLLNETDHSGLQIIRPDGVESHFEINRLFLNYLSSTRTYIDHSEAQIKRRFGNDSEEWKKMDIFRSNLYDSQFSYSFLYKLRNYSQHIGLPITHVVFGINHRQDNKGFSVVFDVSFVREDLISKYDGWSTVLVKLKEMPNRFDAFPIIDSNFENLKSLQNYLLFIYQNKIRDSILVIDTLAKQHIRIERELCIFSGEVTDETGLTSVQIEHIPIELCDKYRN